MAWFQRKEQTPAEQVAARVKNLEKRDVVAVAWDHRFGAIGILTIAVAALIGMALESITKLIKGQLDGGSVVQLTTAFFGVLVMNRALLASARNIRRAEGRGEKPKTRDRVTMYSVLVIESISFGYMLWLLEGKTDIFSIPGLLLIFRAVIIPYATMHLEMQREQPPDPVDIGIQAEIGQGLGVMGDLVTQAWDRTVPTALKLESYRANATMTPEMDARLGRMTQAAQAYDHYKETGEILLVDKAGEPLLRRDTPSHSEGKRGNIITSLFQRNGQARQDGQGEASGNEAARSYTQANNAAPASPSARVAPKTSTTAKRTRPKKTTPKKPDAPTEAIFAWLDEHPTASIRTLAAQFDIAVSTATKERKAWKSARDAVKTSAGPIRTGNGRPPPAPDESALTDEIAELEARLAQQAQQVKDWLSEHKGASWEEASEAFGGMPIGVLQKMAAS